MIRLETVEMTAGISVSSRCKVNRVYVDIQIDTRTVSPGHAHAVRFLFYFFRFFNFSGLRFERVDVTAVAPSALF